MVLRTKPSFAFLQYVLCTLYFSTQTAAIGSPRIMLLSNIENQPKRPLRHFLKPTIMNSIKKFCQLLNENPKNMNYKYFESFLEFLEEKDDQESFSELEFLPP